MAAALKCAKRHALPHAPQPLHSMLVFPFSTASEVSELGSCCLTSLLIHDTDP
eukprot:COSAG06_NODE_24823_length_651_cov_3.101449_1_plen_52_part_10